MVVIYERGVDSFLMVWVIGEKDFCYILVF